MTRIQLWKVIKFSTYYFHLVRNMSICKEKRIKTFEKGARGMGWVSEKEKMNRLRNNARL